MQRVLVELLGMDIVDSLLEKTKYCDAYTSTKNTFYVRI